MDLQQSRSVRHILTGMLASSLVAVCVLFVIYLLLSFGVIKYPFAAKKASVSQKPAVQLQTEYKNPFDKKNQYTNPFSQYKNPFNNLQ